MKKMEQPVHTGRVLVITTLLGLVLTLVLMLGGAALVHTQRIASSTIAYAAIACVATGAFFSALLAAYLTAYYRFLWGIAGGCLPFACFMIISLIWVGQPVVLLRVGVISIMVLITSILGSLLGASIHKKKRRKK